MRVNAAAKMLERNYDSKMFVVNGSVEFATPAEALRQTVHGNPDEYQKASILMMIAELEEKGGKH